MLAISAATAIYNTVTKAATIATKLFNKATKASPLGLLIGLLAAAAGAFLLFTDSSDDATKSIEKQTEAQEKLNKARRAGVALTENVETIEERINKISSLNSRQLDELLQNISTELRANEDKNQRLIELDDELNSKIEAEKVKINETIKRLDSERTQNNAVEIDAQIRLQKQNLENISYLVVRINEGITKNEIEENKKRLESFRLLVSERLKGIKKIEEAENKSISQLKSLRKELSLVNKDIELRAKITKDGIPINEQELDQQKRRREELKEQIKY